MHSNSGKAVNSMFSPLPTTAAKKPMSKSILRGLLLLPNVGKPLRWNYCSSLVADPDAGMRDTHVR